VHIEVGLKVMWLEGNSIGVFVKRSSGTISTISLPSLASSSRLIILTSFSLFRKPRAPPSLVPMNSFHNNPLAFGSTVGVFPIGSSFEHDAKKTMIIGISNFSI